MNVMSSHLLLFLPMTDSYLVLLGGVDVRAQWLPREQLLYALRLLESYVANCHNQPFLPQALCAIAGCPDNDGKSSWLREMSYVGPVVLMTVTL